MHVSGLKPHTPHDVYFDGMIMNDYVVKWDGTMGDLIWPQDDGRVSFSFHYHPDHHLRALGLVNDSTPYSEYVEKMNRLAGPKLVELRSHDGLSSASTMITVNQMAVPANTQYDLTALYAYDWSHITSYDFTGVYGFGLYGVGMY